MGVLGLSKTFARFFSVSPTHFEITADRSMRMSSSPSADATTDAAIVLPVPGSPENSAETPRDSPRWRA